MVDIEETNIGTGAILVNPQGKIILQQRDKKPEILNPGMIAIFGGILKKGDTVEDGLKRELNEELELDITGYRIKKLGVFIKTVEIDNIDDTIYIFVIKNVKEKSLVVHEGAGYICDWPEKILENKKLTRITRLAVETYLKYLKKK